MRHARSVLVLAAALCTGCRRDAVAPEANPAILELTSSINAAGGRALIGFKEAGAARGVDIRGNVLVSDDTQARAKSFLREQGVEITFAFVLLPAVEAKIQATPALVARLRANPNIDYLEAVQYGAFRDSAGTRR